MPQGTKILTDVPEAERDLIANRWRKKGATVTIEKQPDGNYTLTGVFPESAADKSADDKTEGGKKPDQSPGSARSRKPGE